MGKIRFLVAGLFLFGFFLLPSWAQEVDVSGDWELTIESPRGTRTSTVTFVQEGENLTVTMVGPQGRESQGEGTIKGKNIEWSITRSTPQGEFTMIYKGTIEGNAMSGEVQMGERTIEWKATKK